MNKVFLSACLIIKNEELVLEQCLNSIKASVDEIIILDTGSTDKSLDIIESFQKKLSEDSSKTSKLKLYKTEWQGDFSKARNECISYASGDWVLSIDADETLESETAKNLKSFLKNQRQDIPLIFEFKLITPYRSNDFIFASPFFRPTLFRNNSGISYHGQIHESLHTKQAYYYKCHDYAIFHHEAQKPTELLEKKLNSYIEKMESLKNQKDNSEKAYFLLNIAQVFSLLGKSERAYHYYNECYQIFINNSLKENKIYFSAIEGILNELIYQRHDYQLAKVYIGQLLEIKPDYALAYYLLAYTEHFSGNFTGAIEYFHKALESIKNPDKQVKFTIPYDQTILLNTMIELARVYLNTNNENGLKLLYDAYYLERKYPRTLLMLEKYYLENNDLSRAIFFHLKNDFSYSENDLLLLREKARLIYGTEEYMDFLRFQLANILKIPGWTDDEIKKMEKKLGLSG